MAERAVEDGFRDDGLELNFVLLDIKGHSSFCLKLILGVIATNVFCEVSDSSFLSPSGCQI